MCLTFTLAEEPSVSCDKETLDTCACLVRKTEVTFIIAALSEFAVNALKSLAAVFATIRKS